MDKDKMVEEMMIDCQCTEKNTLSLRCRGKDCDTCRLEKLIDKGYRKIPEGAVVLMKEEYEELKQRPEKIHDEMDERMKEELAIEKRMGEKKVEKARKETAKEMLEKVGSIEDCGGIRLKQYSWFANLRKENGVEVE